MKSCENVSLPVLLTCFSDYGSVDNGHDLLCVITQNTVEELLVPVLEIPQVLIFVYGFLERPEILHDNLCLECLRPNRRSQ